MGSHPANLFLRFILEVAALFVVGAWGWNQSDGWLGPALGIILPLCLAGVWGIFAVPNDPSRSGAAPVITPGIIRLFLELAIFAFAVWSVYAMGLNNTGMIFAIVVILHYACSYDRIIWLLSN